MQVNDKPFIDLKKNEEGIVLLGAGGDLNQWISGVTDALIEAGVLPAGSKPEDWIKEAVRLNDNLLGKNGRTDLALVFSPTAKLNMGKMAMWRLGFGSCSWISDYLVNYAKDYKSADLPVSDDEDEEENESKKISSIVDEAIKILKEDDASEDNFGPYGIFAGDLAIKIVDYVHKHTQPNSDQTTNVISILRSIIHRLEGMGYKVDAVLTKGTKYNNGDLK